MSFRLPTVRLDVRFVLLLAIVFVVAITIVTASKAYSFETSMNETDNPYIGNDVEEYVNLAGTLTVDILGNDKVTVLKSISLPLADIYYTGDRVGAIRVTIHPRVDHPEAVNGAYYHVNVTAVARIVTPSEPVITEPIIHDGYYSLKQDKIVVLIESDEIEKLLSQLPIDNSTVQFTIYTTLCLGSGGKDILCLTSQPVELSLFYDKDINDTKPVDPPQPSPQPQPSPTPSPPPPSPEPFDPTKYTYSLKYSYSVLCGSPGFVLIHVVVYAYNDQTGERVAGSSDIVAPFYGDTLPETQTWYLSWDGQRYRLSKTVIGTRLATKTFTVNVPRSVLDEWYDFCTWGHSCAPINRVKDPTCPSGYAGICPSTGEKKCEPIRYTASGDP